MRSVLARALILGVALVGGCKPDPFRPDAGPRPEDAPSPDAPPPYWVPLPGQADDWDIQLARTPFNVSTPRVLYVIDLWDAVPAPTTLDYGDGTPVTVPAGAHAGAIAQLHGLTSKAMAVCHVSTGAIRLDDPDAMKFPGYKANPPNNPNPPEPGSVIGWSTTTTGANERFINIHDGATRAEVARLMGKRIELAKTIGCDAIVTQWNDQLVYQTSPGHGFPDLVGDEYHSWSSELRARAHQRELSIGLRTQTPLGVAGTSPYYDWLMLERCGEYFECDIAKPFVDARKVVFAIEYDIAQSGDPNTATTVCGRQKSAGITTGIIKKAALDSFRTDCP